MPAINAFTLRTPEETQAFYKSLRNSRGHDDAADQLDEDQVLSESAENELMYKVYDVEEGKYIDIRDLEREIKVLDSTTYLDRRHA